jgi:hypothetical protein
MVRAETPKIGLWLDTSAMSLADTVDFILANPAASRAGLRA